MAHSGLRVRYEDIADWPQGVHEAAKALSVYRQSGKGTALQIAALLDALDLLWSERVLAKHSWVERMVRAWCEDDFGAWIAPASVGKSSVAAALALAHWLSAPQKTMVTMCSTTVQMLLKRVFGEVVRYYGALPKELALGQYVRSRTAIVFDSLSPRAGIWGHAIQKGTIKDALANLLGMHLSYQVLVVDEAQEMHEAVLEAVVNMSASGEEFKVLFIGNPDSKLTVLGRVSEPESGWSSITPESVNQAGGSYSSTRGRVHFFDGRLNPRIVDKDGERLYPFLLSSRAIEDTRKVYGASSVQFYSQRIGFFPPDTLSRNVFPEAFIASSRMMKVPDDSFAWRDGYRCFAGLDPAFSSGGDKCILQFIRVGEAADRDNPGGGTMYVLEQPIQIQLSLDRDDISLSDKISSDVIKHCKEHAVGPEELAIDATGSQLILADILDKKFDQEGYTGRVYRVQFGGRASANRVSEECKELGHELYANRVAELWFLLYNFARHKTVRGVTFEQAKELGARLLGTKLKPTNIESKIEMKKRFGHSPDYADAIAISFAIIKERFGYLPGLSQHIGRDITRENFYDSLVDVAEEYDSIVYENDNVYESTIY